MKRRVVFRADGNSSIGYGHFIRTLGIAGIINNDFHCIYATISPTDYQIAEIKNVCDELLILTEIDDHYNEFFNSLIGDEIVVIDDYNFDTSQQLRIREKGCKVIYIDDHNDKFYVCDALINNIPGFSRDSFSKAEYTKLYLGTDYALLRKDFFDTGLRKVKKNTTEIFLAFGGADIYNISKKVLEYLLLIDPSFKINLLIGDAYSHIKDLHKFNRLNTYKNISAHDVALLMATANVCIVPASSLLNEVSSIGSKLMIGYFADNQKGPYEYFVDNKFAIGVGDYRDIKFDLFKDRFLETAGAEYLIVNQRMVYNYQQEDNLKNIFNNV
ncbi:UDP-2,4-diacetamido-2,4,6-trideoxy-beta-L-altropyranose hydrolase [Pedobacter foliorum]|uniref:UDP-2,4-diacetamido-2,4, 6-trideoxy-beta-L-altropyranose hydrolase n=1 Tax=Pedobacter foliorum TaxID=2739058 RepID=UPI0015651D02|nr:UDP-2,4-diacetamido-2,4,6-trideoxy-beta-L-altropyranose hydrolase [Pedobacter foliorum]NRF39191.1 UDP-2,4-diacetamido-2,4,6-trideoxy-beta-L-altropyranose hydrolase [Pedobacter foliorum]